MISSKIQKKEVAIWSFILGALLTGTGVLAVTCQYQDGTDNCPTPKKCEQQCGSVFFSCENVTGAHSDPIDIVDAGTDYSAFENETEICSDIFNCETSETDCGGVNYKCAKAAYFGFTFTPNAQEGTCPCP